VKVRDVRAPVDAATLAALGENTRLQWRAPLPPRDLGEVRAWISSRPAAAIRLYGDAIAQFENASRWLSFGRLTLDGVCENLGRILEEFPALTILRIVARGATVDARELSGCVALRGLSIAAGRIINAAALSHLPALRALELRDVTIDHAAAVLRPSGLRALRLAKIAGFTSIAAVAEHPALRVLSLGPLMDLESIAPVEQLPHLESLELAGLWQFSVAEAAFITRMKSLRRLRIDIGGKRKNVEIYKRCKTTLPDPFDVGNYDCATSNELGVHSVPANRSSVTTNGADREF
jgi:hypothetical protein